jgi:hypothetical protein
MINRAFFASALLSLLANQVGAKELCNLCKNGVVGIRWPKHKIDSSGITCAQKSVHMAKIPVDSAACRSEMSKWRSVCCGNQKPVEVPQKPTSPPRYDGPRGNNEPCELCYTGDYPGNTAMVINVLYLGAGSCAQYWGYGQGGLIPPHLCDTIQVRHPSL